MIEEIAASQARYQQFLKRAAEAGSVWTLDNGRGVANVNSNDDDERVVMLFWSAPALARHCAAQEWAEYEAKEIPLQLFIDRWITGMATDKTLVGPEWNQHLLGLEVEPMTVLEDLKKAMNTPPTSGKPA